MTPEQIATLADYAMETSFLPGELIFREGDTANRFYLIVEGRVALEGKGADGKTILVEDVGPGQALGWSWLFPPYSWHFTAHALEPTHGIFLYGTWLREQCDRDPVLGYDLMKRVAAVCIQRMQAARGLFMNASPLPCSRKAPCHDQTIERKNSNERLITV